VSVKFKSLLLLKASATRLKCFCGGFFFTMYLFLRLALIQIGLFFVWRTLRIQEEFYSSGVECSANETAASRLAAWSLQSEPCRWMLVPAATGHWSSCRFRRAWIVLSTLRSSFSRKTMLVKLSKHLLIFVVKNFFNSEREILHLQSAGHGGWLEPTEGGDGTPPKCFILGKMKSLNDNSFVQWN